MKQRSRCLGYIAGCWRASATVRACRHDSSRRRKEQMCGIALCCLPDVSLIAPTIERMVAVQRHRGPDESRTLVETLPASRGLGLGHNRLAIIDLSESAAQPMVTRDGRFVLIYNGEVYNYKEIARDLNVAALRGDKGGDTAIVLAALTTWGPSALGRFNGMWALALYDRRERTLLLSRDRFGKKPLYYMQDGEEFFVASEVKTILAASRRRVSVNPAVAIPYLTRGLSDFSDETFFSEVRQFPAASFELLPLSRCPKIGAGVRRYWRHPAESGRTSRDTEVPVSAIRDVFEDAVRLRLRSDVPVGVLLSGGIDSSAIVGAIADAGALSNVSILSVISNEPSLSEEPFIDAMTKYVGASTIKLNVSEDPRELLAGLDEAVWFNDAPLNAMSSLPHRELMRMAQERGIKVLITGQGGDEQLGGYNKCVFFFWRALWAEGKYGAAIRSMWQFTRRGQVLTEFRPSEAMRYAGKRWLAEHTFIGPRYQERDSVDIGPRASYQEREWIDVTRTSVPALLHSEDRMAMSHSVEMRVPFLDYRLVELLARVSPSAKFEGGWTKAVFREAIKGLVPEEIRLRRDKKGFSVPGDRWMRETVIADVKRTFEGPMRSEALGLVDGRRLRTAYARFCEGRGHLNGRQFFRAFAFEKFLHRFSAYLKEC